MTPKYSSRQPLLRSDWQSMMSWAGGSGGGVSPQAMQQQQHVAATVPAGNGGSGPWRMILQHSTLLLMVLLLFSIELGHVSAINNKKFGDKCNKTRECSFKSAVCQLNDARTFTTCQCEEEYPITNHIDKCGKPIPVNGSCNFDAQCEAFTVQTKCRDGLCACLFEQTAIMKSDGSYECISIKDVPQIGTYIDPTMIGILVAMFLMFITICVVLRLFSRARWRENRTIFNTPNPRLMNVSLLRENKLLHERRGSRGSVRGPSRAPSMASLRPHSPSSQPGSRRGSRGSESPTSAKSPTGKHHHHHNSATTPMLESVTVEVQGHK